LTLVFEVVAIVMLSRAFSKGHWIRSLFSGLSTCMSLLVLFLFGLFAWLDFVKFAQLP